MDIKTLEASSALAWVSLNNFVNENQQPIEFKDHRFMLDIYADEHPDIVCKKSAQVGFSVMAILKCLWIIKYAGLNIIYVLPTDNLMKDFVVPKVNPLIYSNPSIRDSMESDRENLKSINKRFLYFSGASTDRQAISKTADVLILDEFDRMPSMQVVNTFDSRLQASKSPKRWRFSNPSQIGFGVDGLYNDSDQMHWFVTCTQCGYKSYMDFAKEIGWTDRNGDHFSHYVDQERRIYACGQCDKEITNDNRRNGEWIAKHPNHKRRGYWISQMMAPWVSAERIIEQKEESNIEFFHNFVLGKAYTPSDMVVNRESILRATAPSIIARSQVSIGVDQDAGGCYYVCMTPQGIFSHGYVKSWEEIEHLKLMYNAIVVCDPNPYQAMPKQMAAKYSDWYLCYFKNLDGLSSIQWKEKEQIVYADRTRVIDIRANEIVNARLLYREHVHELEDVIKHWNNLYRTTVEAEDGRVKSTWIKKDDKQSDYPFAEVYARIGLSQLLGGSSDLVDGSIEADTPITNISTTDGEKLTVDFSGILADTMADME